ncbi:MAG: uridine phosphorylase [Candidatus Magasanikbacteria bacterium CG10_big_fil_rev_8_21_14_0_10_47_10]|uniref:Uridine phosphorylase n=1 Tax=Candidatus Magasanikbacteria bacterium CG10_big_fil_rev_8_21_14_0_10_47_10 TaxID=1974652 RepID=A0A2H0TR39_9BACT|nr:MAG: uridine phosphorylase [Candidatus Magasanikbacteria bacterium CG10_big_fil_rev_8_21_14_0_10_47_10]
MTVQPHLKIEAKDISPHVLLPGDPARVDIIGACLDDFCILSTNREYRCGIGSYGGKRITVCSTGIGCPSTAIATEELINAGAKYLIRVGTCGGAWRSDIPTGSLIIPTASVRDEGTTVEYIPQGFPAIADREIVNALVQSSEEQNAKYAIGINRTHDAFYGSQGAIAKWGMYLKEDRWKNEETPILSSEMESAALFVVASLRNVKAGAIFAVNANPEPLKDRMNNKDIAVVTENSEEISKQAIDTMIRVALEAMLKLP